MTTPAGATAGEAASGGAAALEFDPHNPEHLADPYPLYRRLRLEDPCHWSPGGFWVVSRYADVLAMLRDDRFGRKGCEDSRVARYGPRGGLGRSMLFRDPPDHTRLRALVSQAFTPRSVEALRPHVQRSVDAALERVHGAGHMDLIADVAYPVSINVICEMLGVPVEDRVVFKEWSLDIARSLDSVDVPAAPEVVAAGNQSSLGRRDYFRRLIAERRQRPRADLLSALIAAEEGGDRLTEPELLATCSLLLIAGFETTANLIGNGMLALLRHEDQLARLRSEPGLITSAVEELLRYDSPLTRNGRVAVEDVTIRGSRIRRGQLVVGLLGAANRDPDEFPDPDRLDLGRAGHRHVAFGWGIHFCLGAPLARLEGDVTIGTLVRRLPKLRLGVGAPRWRPTVTVRGLESLPVAF